MISALESAFLPAALKQLHIWTEDHPKALGSPNTDGPVGKLALPPGQWHRTPTTQETDGFQVKRPGDLSVRCTLLLMLDYQVGVTLARTPPTPTTPPHSPLSSYAASLGAHRQGPDATPEPLSLSSSHFPGKPFLASPVQTGPALGPAAGAAHPEPLSHRPGSVAVCEDQQAAGLPRQGVHQRGQVFPAGNRCP